MYKLQLHTTSLMKEIQKGILRSFMVVPVSCQSPNQHLNTFGYTEYLCMLYAAWGTLWTSHH